MKFVIANWKMNGDLALVADFKRKFNCCKNERYPKIVVCPPAALLKAFSEFPYDLGAQNCFYESHGAFTGENSPELLKELGCKYVILGHSERRSIFGESDELIFKKWQKVTDLGLTPILCIGENSDQRTKWKDVLEKQLEKYALEAPKLYGTIFAYEPIWSIGTGKIPSMNEIEDVAGFIRDTLGDCNYNSTKDDGATADHCCQRSDYYVVYGGSVKSSNVAQIIRTKGVDGVLIGSASLKSEEFQKIIEETMEY